MGRGRWHNTIRSDTDYKNYRIERHQKKVAFCGSNNTSAVTSSISEILSSMWLAGCRLPKRKGHKEKNKPVSDNNIPEIVIQNGDE